jgi:hypothetical protein
MEAPIKIRVRLSDGTFPFLSPIKSAKDVLAFIAAMRANANGPRTIANRVVYLKSFFHRFGLKSPLLKTDRVRCTEKVVSAYSVPELRGLFAAEYDPFSVLPMRR